MAGASDRTLRLVARLAGGDPEAAAVAMSQTRVQLVALRPSTADEIALALTATLLLRLDRVAPVLAIDTATARSIRLPLLGDGPIVDALAAAHDGFESVGRLRTGTIENADLRLVFGSSAPGLSVRSSGWVAAIGEATGETAGNPIAASYAGVLASSEALKIGLLRAGLSVGRARPWRGAISLWDHSLGASPGPDLPDTVDLSGHTFAGAGGVATAAGWVLSFVSPSGEPHIVDFDYLDETNLNRHLSATFEGVGDPKAKLVAAMLASDRCRPVIHTCRWQDLQRECRSPRVAVVSVDDDSTRRDVQLDMPRTILNGGTSDDGVYRLSVHDFISGACLGCISRSDRRHTGLLESVADRLGVSPGDLAPYVRSTEPLPAAVLDRARLDPELREQLATVDGRAFLELACGQLRVTSGEPAVSAPMLSAAPGVLLATAVVKGVIGGAEEGGTEVRTSILSGPHARWRRRLEKRSDCECLDSMYASHYRSKWRVDAATRDQPD